MKNKKKKILIIGAKGMLGQCLVKIFSNDEKSYELFAWDKDEIDLGGALQIKQKITSLSPDIIINTAAYNNVDGCEEREDLANLINGFAVGNLANAAKEVGALVVHYSTGYVFDGKNQAGYAEEDKPSPISKYGNSKYLGEMELAKETNKFYLVRTNLLFGSAAKIEGAKKSFIDLVLDLTKKQDSLKFVADEVSNPTYAVDLAEATKRLIEEKYSFGTYHLVNDGAASWYDWAKEIFRLKYINKEIKPCFSNDYPRTAKRPKNSALINSKFPKLRSWQKALEEYLKISNIKI